jgi:anti-sigma factor RsiW
MNDVTREQLHAYLDDALDEAETARIEKLVRSSAGVRTRLAQIRDERDRGEHSLGAIWRRERLSCVTREQLSAYLHGVLDRDFLAYVDFHINTIVCAACVANLEDLREKQTEPAAQTRRRKRYFETSARLLGGNRK